MSAARLILIEGMIGAGKTTTAGWVERWLSGRGEDARAFTESAEDNPIRTRAVDRLRAAAAADAGHPDPAGVLAAGEPGGYAVSQWGQLAERCARGPQAVILESAFLQNSVMPAFIDDAPASAVTGAFTAIVGEAAPAEPLLVYLRPTDIASAIARTHESRGQPWSGRNVAFVESCPWARRRNLRGRDAVVELYRAWELIVGQLLDRYPFPKLVVSDPQHDWPAALTRIGAALRP